MGHHNLLRLRHRRLPSVWSAKTKSRWFLAPSRILGGHLSDQLPEVLRQAGSSDWLGLPAPEQSKSFAVPTDERIRLHVHQRIAPREYSAQGRHHPPSGVVGASRSNLSL